MIAAVKEAWETPLRICFAGIKLVFILTMMQISLFQKSTAPKKTCAAAQHFGVNALKPLPVRLANSLPSMARTSIKFHSTLQARKKNAGKTDQAENNEDGTKLSSSPGKRSAAHPLFNGFRFP
jgi:hypothetical protein